MASFTTNYNLDLYEAGDIPNLLDQYNGAMGKVDTALAVSELLGERDCCVVNARFLAPFDAEMARKLAAGRVTVSPQTGGRPSESQSPTDRSGVRPAACR